MRRAPHAHRHPGSHLLTLAVNCEGLPLGVLRCGFDAPPAAGENAAGDDVVAGAAAELSRKTRVVGVMDREADCFELFDRRRQLDRVEVLVRAKHDRRLGPDGPKLFAVMRAGAVGGHVEIEIDRLSERKKSSRKPARPKRTGRLARAEVAEIPVCVQSRARNARCRRGGTRAASRLPHRRPAATGHRNQYRDRLAAMAMTLLGRDMPECCELMFTDIELRFLRDYADDIGRSPPPNLGAAVLLVAILGGYQNRKHDPPPGNQLMWRGYERISTATLGYRMAERRRERSGVVQNE